MSDEVLSEINDVIMRHVEVMDDQRSLHKENLDMLTEIALHMLPLQLQGKLEVILGFAPEHPELIRIFKRTYKFTIAWRPKREARPDSLFSGPFGMDDVSDAFKRKYKDILANPNAYIEAEQNKGSNKQGYHDNKPDQELPDWYKDKWRHLM